MKLLTRFMVFFTGFEIAISRQVDPFHLMTLRRELATWEARRDRLEVLS